MRARTRLVHPEFFAHAKLAAAERKAQLPLRLAFIGLWCIADRRGCFQWRPDELKLAVLPFDDVEFSAVLKALEKGGFVRRYRVEGETYGVIPKLSKWQHFHVREKADSHIPDVPAIVLANGQAHASTVLAPEIPGEASPRLPASASASASDVISASVTPPTGGPGGAQQPRNGHPPEKQHRRKKRRPSRDPDSTDTYVDRLIRGDSK